MTGQYHTPAQARQAAAWIEEVRHQGYMVTHPRDTAPHTRVHDWCDLCGIPFARIIVARRYAVLSVDFSSVTHASQAMTDAAMLAVEHLYPAKGPQRGRRPQYMGEGRYWYIYDWPADTAHELMRALLAIAMPSRASGPTLDADAVRVAK